MTRSAILRRVYASVLAALVITVIAVYCVFSAMSGTVFIKLRAAELLPQAQSFAVLARSYIKGEVSGEVLTALTDGTTPGAVSAYALITDAGGNILFLSSPSDAPDQALLRPSIDEALNGKSIYTKIGADRQVGLLVVAVPVTEEGGAIIGSLLLYLAQVDAMLAKATLTRSLAASMLIVTPIVFLIMYALVYKLVKPLRQMRDVALRMAEGRFDYSADEDAAGEIGQLGASLNKLSRSLKSSIRALTFERNRLIRVLNGLTEGIAAIDSLGRITHINPALEKLFGKNPAIADPRLRVIPDATVWEALDRAVKEDASCEFNISYNNRDIRVSVSPVHDDENHTAGAVGLFTDISREVALEQTRREYVANVSHEMRSPLTAMRALIEPLSDGLVKDEETRSRYYGIMLRETMRLSRLISDIMELSKLQSGSSAIEREVFAPGEIMADVTARFASVAEEKGLTLSLACDPDALPLLYGNPDRFEQLLVILTDNAIKYTDEGSVKIDACVQSEKLLVRVTDTGRGISQSDLPKVFDRFYKVDKAHSGMGSGLGLSIAKEIQTAMGEAIWAESREGEGSSFIFTNEIDKGGALVVSAGR